MNKIVEQFKLLQFTGNVTPHSWFRSPLLQMENGKPNLVAIILLADIVYWYRPVEIRDETSGQLLGYRQKFSSDKLQKSYAAWGESFGLTKRQVGDAMSFLKKSGVITVELRDISKEGRMFFNCAFIEPVISVLKTMTYPSDSEQRSPVVTGDPSRYNVTPMTLQRDKPSRSNVTPIPLQRDTSKSTLEIKTKNISGEQIPSDSSASLFPDNTVPKKEEAPWKAGYRALTKAEKSVLCQRAGILAGLPEKDVAGRTAAAKVLFEKEWKS